MTFPESPILRVSSAHLNRLYLSWVIFENPFGFQEQGNLSTEDHFPPYSLHLASRGTCLTEQRAFASSGPETLSPLPKTAQETHPRLVFADKAAGSFRAGTAHGISPPPPPPSSGLHTHSGRWWGGCARLFLRPKFGVGMGRRCPGAVGSFRSRPGQVCPLRFPRSTGVAVWMALPHLQISQRASSPVAPTPRAHLSAVSWQIPGRAGKASKGFPGGA